MPPFNPFTGASRGTRPGAVSGLRVPADPLQALRGGGPPPGAMRPGSAPTRPAGIPGATPRTRTPLPRGAGVARRPAPTRAAGQQSRAAVSRRPTPTSGRPPVRRDYNRTGSIPPIPGTEAASVAQAQQAQQGAPPPQGVPQGAPPPPAAGPTLMAGGVPGVGQPGAVAGGPPGAGMNTGQVAGMGMKPNVRRRTA
jgi:hypothetical protein